MAGASNTLRGKIVHLNIEENYGIIRIDAPENAENRPNEVQFNLSDLVIDQRYISEIIPGMQVECTIAEPRTGSRVRPLDSMIYEGIVTSIHRHDGLAEVTVEELDTTIAFSRSHLEDPDAFQRVREGHRVRVDIGFYNFVSRRKPPRANKVVLLDSCDPENVQLRPALRRSTSASGRRPRSLDDMTLEGTVRRRSSSNGRQPDSQTSSMPPPGSGYDHCFPANSCPTRWNHPNSPLMSAAGFFQMPPFGQLSFMPLPPGWLPSPPLLDLPPGPRVVPPGPHRAPPVPPRAPRQAAGAAGAAAAPSPSPPPGGHGSPRSSSSSSGSGSRPGSGLSHPDAFFGFAPESDVDIDESDVVLEMTVNELRDLMRQRRP